MLFNSFQFLIFLPIVFCLYWFVFKKRNWQNLLVVLASYVFYGWWDWRFLFLIIFTSLCSYISGLLSERFKNCLNKRLVCVTNIVINLIVLFIFKYYNFFTENLDLLVFNITGAHLNWSTVEIILPVGISFYTFQALSYTIDVYRGNIRATHDIVEFFAYISFFPQLVAGPIERATNLLPQFQKSRVFDYDIAVDGLRQMLWGFFKKMLIADNCALAVNQIFDDYQGHTGLVLLVGAVLFTFQIYCDFSGYSDIAIGCAKLFGIKLMRNFNVPYFSRSIPEFWRRWHISLTTWFRDYIYFPLGGSRCEKWKIIRNVFIVWAISGLWHGANWTFICWGLFHAFLLAIYNIFGINTKYSHVVAFNKWLPNIKEFAQMILTFTLAMIGWIIFRAECLSDAINYIASMFSSSLFDTSELIANMGEMKLTNSFLAISFLLVFEWIQRDRLHTLQIFGNNRFSRNRVIRYSFYILLLILTLGLAGSQSEFIYFQF